MTPDLLVGSWGREGMEKLGRKGIKLSHMAIDPHLLAARPTAAACRSRTEQTDRRTDNCFIDILRYAHSVNKSRSTATRWHNTEHKAQTHMHTNVMVRKPVTGLWPPPPCRRGCYMKTGTLESSDHGKLKKISTLQRKIH